jgi:uncharacterized membrane protein
VERKRKKEKKERNQRVKEEKMKYSVLNILGVFTVVFCFHSCFLGTSKESGIQEQRKRFIAMKWRLY